MRTRIYVSVLAAAAAAFTLSGCSTFNSRAREKSATYESLTPQEQARLKQRQISVGDNQDMTYIALGNPDEKRQITTGDGTQQVWIYRSYWEQYEGTAWLGYRRYLVPSPTGRGFLIYHEPVTQDVYRTHVDEVIRVTFDRNGIVQSVEQSNRR